MGRRSGGARLWTCQSLLEVVRAVPVQNQCDLGSRARAQKWFTATEAYS